MIVTSNSKHSHWFYSLLDPLAKEALGTLDSSSWKKSICRVDASDHFTRLTSFWDTFISP